MKTSKKGKELLKYSMASVKGGVGKTTVTANLGVILGRGGKKILLVDADLASGNLAFYLGLKDPSPTLHELLSGEDVSVREVKKEVSEGVDILPSGSTLRGFLRANVDLLPEVISKASGGYELVLIDCPPGISQNSIAPLRASDRVLLVTTPDWPAISASENLLGVARLLEREVEGIIVNRKRKRSFFAWLFTKSTQVDLKEIEAKLGAKILGVIPEDEEVEKAAELGNPVVTRNPGASASKAFEGLSSKF